MNPAITQPGVINEPGDYYLANDIVITDVSQLTNGAALYITAPSVRINMNAKKVRGVGLSPNYPSCGVKAASTNNLVLFDGQVGGVTGFWCGVWSDTPWTRLQELDVSGNFYMGACLNAHTARLYYNKIDGIAGTTNEAYAIGLNISGANCEVRGNVIRNIYRQAGAPGNLVGEGCLINLTSSSSNCTVERNWLENDTECAHTIGIFAGSGGSHTITGNNIAGMFSGVVGGGTPTSPAASRLNHVVRKIQTSGSAGITCDYGVTESNLIFNCQNPVGLAAAGSGNVVASTAS